MFNTINRELNYISLFSGIGGFEQAINYFGGNCLLSSEIDTKTNKCYSYIYGEETVGDITKVHLNSIPEHTLLVGGFPCQSFSIAGKRDGFNDSRGTLFFEVARIAKEKQPSYLLLENVKGLLSHNNGMTIDTICKTLHAIGYTFDITVLNSRQFGIAQNRERLFFMCIRNDLISDDIKDSFHLEGTDLLAKTKKRLNTYHLNTFNFNWIHSIDELSEKERCDLSIVSKTLKDTLLEPKGVDKTFYLKEKIQEKLIESSLETIHKKLVANEPLDRFEHLILNDREVPDGSYGIRLCYTSIYGDSDINPCLSARDYKGLSMKQAMGGVIERYGDSLLLRRLTPKEYFRLQGFDEDVFNRLVEKKVSNTQLFKMAGNSVTVPVIKTIVYRLLTTFHHDNHCKGGEIDD